MVNHIPDSVIIAVASEISEVGQDTWSFPFKLTEEGSMNAKYIVLDIKSPTIADTDQIDYIRMKIIVKDMATTEWEPEPDFQPSMIEAMNEMKTGSLVIEGSDLERVKMAFDALTL